MATSSLNEDRRKQLDDIVMRMEKNQETPEAIQFVVNDFKNKYGTQSSSQAKKSGSDIAKIAAKTLYRETPMYKVGAQIQRGMDFAKDKINQGIEAGVQLPGVRRFPKTAAALGTAASTAMEFVPTPRDIPLMAVSAGVGKVAKLAGPIIRKKLAVPAARRALGFVKSLLHQNKNPAETARLIVRAEQSASDLLEKGAIDKFGSTKKTLESVNKIANAAKQTRDKIVSFLDSKGYGMSPKLAAGRIRFTIKPKFKEETETIANIFDDISQAAGKKGFLNMKDQVELIERWGNKGYSGNPKNPIVKLYRDAWRSMKSLAKEEVEIASGVIEKTTAGAPKGVIKKTFDVAQKNLGRAVNALSGLTQKAAGEAGNLFPSPLSIVTGIGGLAAGGQPGESMATKVMRGVTAMGAAEAARRRGFGVAANLFNSVAKTNPALPKALTYTLLKALNRRKDNNGK